MRTNRPDERNTGRPSARCLRAEECAGGGVEVEVPIGTNSAGRVRRTIQHSLSIRSVGTISTRSSLWACCTSRACNTLWALCSGRACGTRRALCSRGTSSTLWTLRAGSTRSSNRTLRPLWTHKRSSDAPVASRLRAVDHSARGVDVEVAVGTDGTGWCGCSVEHGAAVSAGGPGRTRSTLWTGSPDGPCRSCCSGRACISRNPLWTLRTSSTRSTSRTLRPLWTHKRCSDAPATSGLRAVDHSARGIDVEVADGTEGTGRYRRSIEHGAAVSTRGPGRTCGAGRPLLARWPCGARGTGSTGWPRGSLWSRRSLRPGRPLNGADILPCIGVVAPHIQAAVHQVGITGVARTR